ncbi:GA-like domain-containing protein [Staphylococcus simulans]
MTSQDGGGTTANIKFLSNVDKTRLDELYNNVATGAPVNTVLKGIQAINNDLHPVSGLLNIYDLDDYDEYKAADVRKSVTFNRNEINELYISNKPSAQATANLELKDNKMIISTGQSPKGGYDEYPNRVTATFKDKSELTYSMTGRNASGTAFHVKGILLVPVQPYTVQVMNPAGNQDAKVTLTQYIPTREVYQTATLPRNIEMTAEFPQGIVANAQSTTGYFVATNNNTNKVIITDNNTALNQQDFYDKTYTLPITLKHNLTVKDIQSNSAKWIKLKTYYDGNVLNVPVKWSFDNGTKQFKNLTTDHQTIPLKVSNELKKEIDKQIMAEATASVEEAKRAHAKAKATAQTIPMDQLVSKNEMDGLKNEVQTATTKKNDAQTKVNQLPERLKTNLQHELDQLTEIALPDVNDENNNGITDDQDQLIAKAEALLKATQEAEDTAKAALTAADVNHAISPEEHNQLAALQHDFTTKKKAAETQIKAVHEKYQTPLIEKLNQLNGITVPEVNDTNNNGKPDTEDAKEQQDAALQAATALVEKAEGADQAAQTQSQQTNADNLVTPQEHTNLSAAKTNAETTKATADTAVKALPQALQAPLLEKLAALKGITVPDINDKNVNNIPDDQDVLIKEAEDLLAAAKKADQSAKDALSKATEDQAINQQEHDNLENLQQDFTTKKQAAKEKINTVEEKHRGELPTQLEALKGITVPAVNDTNNNGKPDAEDAKEQQAEALKNAEDLVKKAEGADQAAQTQLQ